MEIRCTEGRMLCSCNRSTTFIFALDQTCNHYIINSNAKVMGFIEIANYFLEKNAASACHLLEALFHGRDRVNYEVLLE